MTLAGLPQLSTLLVRLSGMFSISGTDCLLRRVDDINHTILMMSRLLPRQSTTMTGDREEYVLDTRIGYEIQSEYEAFVQLIWKMVDYEAARDDNGLNRDSDGYEIRIGTRIDLTGLLFGDVFVGYVNREYDDASLKSVDKVVGGVDLTWNVTPLTTIKGGFSRLISETTLATASGTISTKIRASVDHELLRNLILSAVGSVSTDEFEGGIREDDNLSAGVGAKYLLNRNFSILLNYDHLERESNTSGADYKSNRVFLRVQGHL